MNRKVAKEILPIIQAYAEGKTIQFRAHTNDEWEDIKELVLNGFTGEYRIKPQQKYRPFKSQEECWKEMHKHPDFGWVIAKDSKIMYYIYIVGTGYVLIDGISISFSETFAEYEFTDGTPFGIKENVL